jgi:hypothetical protein
VGGQVVRFLPPDASGKEYPVVRFSNGVEAKVLEEEWSIEQPVVRMMMTMVMMMMMMMMMVMVVMMMMMMMMMILMAPEYEEKGERDRGCTLESILYTMTPPPLPLRAFQKYTPALEEFLAAPSVASEGWREDP